jgi:hypothetical protein
MGQWGVVDHVRAVVERRDLPKALNGDLKPQVIVRRAGKRR